MLMHGYPILHRTNVDPGIIIVGTLTELVHGSCEEPSP